MRPDPAALEAILSEKDGRIHLTLRVTPGSSRDRVRGLHGEALKVSVQAPPEKGKANEAVLGLLAGALGLRRAQLALVSGRSGRDKCVAVEGIERGELLARLAAIL